MITSVSVFIKSTFLYNFQGCNHDIYCYKHLLRLPDLQLQAVRDEHLGGGLLQVYRPGSYASRIIHSLCLDQVTGRFGILGKMCPPPISILPNIIFACFLI